MSFKIRAIKSESVKKKKKKKREEGMERSEGGERDEGGRESERGELFQLYYELDFVYSARTVFIYILGNINDSTFLFKCFFFLFFCWN